MHFLALAAVAALTASALGTEWKGCMSRIDAVYEFPNTPLAWLNPFLRGDPDYEALVKRGCPDGRPAGDVCFDKPSAGSGLAQLHPNYFLGLTDQGPNQACAALSADPARYPHAVGKKGKGFPVPRFAPSIVHFETDRSRTLRRRLAVPLAGTDGAPVSGLPNSAADGAAYGADCAGAPLAPDPSGLDPEDLALIPGTRFVAIVDEYAPSVLIVDFQTGRIAARHVPRSKASALAGASYPVVGDIPDVFARRRRNRGFEGVVADAAGKYVIAILQSPMLGDDAAQTARNAIIRCAYFDVTVTDGVPALKYARSFAIEASPPRAFAQGTAPKDVMYSAAQYHSPGKFVALERAKGQAKLFLIDFTRATNLDETKYADSLGLERDTNGARLAAQVGVRTAQKTLLWDSAPGIGGTLGFPVFSKQEGFAIDSKDPTKAWLMEDNDFGLNGGANVKLTKVTLGRAADGATVCPAPEHPAAPVMDVNPTRTIRLVRPATHRISKTVGGGAAENMDVDEDAKVAYVANDETGAVDSYDASVSPVAPLGSYRPASNDFAPTSVSVCKTQDRVAVALASSNSSLPGRVDIVTKALRLETSVARPGCFLPDSVKFSADCAFLVAACEGEGEDIPGGVMVIDLNGPGGAFRGAKVATFRRYDAKAAELRAKGVRLIESAAASLDVQPEFVSIDGNHALVTLQETNAIAVVDLLEATIAELRPIGFIDRSRQGFALDASNRDGGINIRNYPFLVGMPQPDTIVPYVARDGRTYFVIANEGDALETEEARGKDITDPEELNRTAVPGLKELVEDPALLGRLKFSTVEGYNAATNTQERMFHFGSRSFSIMSLDGAVVFDSGEWFARIMERHFAEIFNANGLDSDDLTKTQADLVDNRSDDKGGEPESLALFTTPTGVTYAFIGLERPSIIVVFDISNPRRPVFVDAAQNNPTDVPIGTLFETGRQGDIDPEGMFASLKLKKLFIAGSASNTVSTYNIEGL